MSFMRTRTADLLAVAATAIGAFAPAFAVNECLTSNCSLSGTPVQCANRAAPRTPTVLMGSAGLVFTPTNPKIEPGDCIIWRSMSVTHSGTGDTCTATLACNTLPSPGCEWDTANVASGAARTCYYDPVLFPPMSVPPFHCRFHASMDGTLQVTTPIQLMLDKDLGTNSVKLTWSGGGVLGDFSYKVERQSGGDPGFPTASTLTMDPDGGVLGTTFTDVAGDLADPTTRYYLVRNKQSNEP